MKKIMLNILNVFILVIMVLLALRATNVIAAEYSWEVKGKDIFHCIIDKNVKKCSKFPKTYFKDKLIVIKVVNPKGA